MLERQRARDRRPGATKLAVSIGLILLETSLQPSYAEFTCAAGYASCPDDSVQATSSGGRVYAMIHRAINLPDQDEFPQSGLSDPYVRIEVGSIKATTAVMDETLNPVWEENVDLGYHNSGDPVSITVLDADSGLEFGDDVLYSIQVRVPWCSAFHADAVTADCGNSYECDIQDTAWSMPTQLLCDETSWVYLGGASDGVGGESGCDVNGNYSCVKLRFTIVPFQVEILETYSGDPFLLTVAGYDGSLVGESDYDDYGKVYNDQSQLLGYETSRTMFDDLRGGIMVRTDSDEAGTTGGGKAVDFAINAESTVWVCKWNEDTIAFGDPSWLTNGGWELKSTDSVYKPRALAISSNQPKLSPSAPELYRFSVYSRRDYLDLLPELSARAYLYGYLDTAEYFACWSKLFSPTARNYWGGVESDPVTLYANGVDGREDVMYMVVIVPRVDDQTTTATYSSELDSTVFWRNFLEHIVTGAFFSWISRKFLTAKGFRVELMEAHIMQAAVGCEREGNRSVLRHLMATHGKTKNNIEFRRNLCLALFASRLSLLLPIFMLWAWGLTAIITVNPPAVGFLLCFVGTSCALGWFGFNHWRARGWLMDWASLCCILASVLLFLAFLAAVVFVDPAAYFGSEDLDFCGLTGVFFAFDMLPLAFLLFFNDSKLKRSVNKLGHVVGEVIRLKEMKGTNTTTKISPTLNRTLSEETMLNLDSASVARMVTKKDANTETGEIMAKNPFYSLLGDCYTIVASLKTFRFSDIISVNLLATSPSSRKRRNRQLYGLSLAFLLSYLAISAARTKYGHLALLNIATLTVLDSCHFGIYRGSIDWSPGYGILLMGAARVAMMSFMAELWLVGYSIALVVYGGALVHEVVNDRLPQLSKEEAGAAVFLGHEPRGNKCDDVAATPEVVLAYMCLYFVVVLVILLYGGPANLPVPTVPMWSQQWPAYIFPLAGILVVMSSGFFVAWLRSLSLSKQGLLPARFGAVFFWHRGLRLSAILAAATAFSVFCTGLLVWVATGSSAQFKVCLCLPAIVLLGRATYSGWVKNDYTLVDWPPDRDKDKAAGIKMVDEEDDPLDTAKVAAGLVGDLFRPDELGGISGADGASVIEGGDAFENDIQMPALPLKNVLHRTRIAEQCQAEGFGGADDMPGTVVSEDVHEGGDGAFAPSFAGDEVNAMVRPKYVRRRSLLGAEKEEDELKLGFWIRMGEEISRIIERERPACLICPRIRKKRGFKIGSAEHDGGAGAGSFEQEKLPEERGNGNDDVDEEQGEVHVESLSFRRAFLEGYLLPHEYHACYGFAACVLLIVIMGLLLAREEPGWVGHLIWTGMLVVIFTFLPAAKWFGTYEVDAGMKLSLSLAGILLTTSCALMFVLVLDGEAFQDHSLAVLNAFLAYPIIAYGIFSVFQAVDGPTPSSRKEVNVDEQLDEDVYKLCRLFAAVFCRIIGCFLTFKFLLATVTSLWLLQSFLWGGFYVCFGLTIAVALAVIMGRVMQDYTSQGSIVSRSYAGGITRFISSAVMVGCLVAALWGVGAEAFFFTVFFLIWIVRIVISVATRLLEFEPDTIIYFAPWVFPAFTYDARTGNLVDETFITCQAFGGMLVGVAWGVAVAVFVEPLGLGVVIACIFLMALASAAAWCVSHSPSRLGVAAQFLDSSLVFEAGEVARSCLISKYAAFKVDCPEFSGRENTRGNGKTRSATEAAMRFEARESAADLAMGLEEKKELLRVVLDEETDSDRLRFDALYTLGDAIMEAFVSGKGPFGPIGLYGLWFGILRLLALLGRTRCLRCFGEEHNPLLTRYLPDGHRRDAYTLSPPLNHPEILLEILDDERAFQGAFRDELTCMMHFQILVLLSAEARLQRERVLFRKFFKDNHFKLLSNGIVLPKKIYSSNSFASVNIPMVATWLSSLTREERDRFQMLRRKFSEMQSYRDAEIVRANEAHGHAAKELEERRKLPGREKSEKQKEALARRRTERANAWNERLSAEDQQKFEGVRAQWLSQHCVTVHTKDQELRESFEKEVLLRGEEVDAFAREILEEIESKARDCRPGAYGRERQFADPEFPPDNSSVGNAQCRQQLAQQWKVSLSVNPDIRLFDEGTDPDDVRRGAFADTWLLSALSMISAATVGDGGVDEQIAQLFVSPIGKDGRPVFESCTGAYAVKIMIDGEWQVVIVDDFFPALEFTNADDDNKGLAVGHSCGARELWVSLLEKAYAKFYGNYAALETGYVHHVLAAFTGAQSEEIFLAGVGRGIGKKGLWKKMKRYRRNGYIMGAGTITSNLVEKQVQDIGLVFGAAYTVLEVLDSYGEQLIKLRNPPGNHEEWRGDWGDHSPLWTRRRRERLGFVDNDRDNAFWMSFNDFCVVFRSLYICRWYDPRSSRRFRIPRAEVLRTLRRDSELLETSVGIGNETFLFKTREITFTPMSPNRYAVMGEINRLISSRKWSRVNQPGSWEIREDLDTAAGLPSAQQKVCELENNPQFTLEIDQQTDIKISLIQTGEEVQPAACFVFREDRPGRGSAGAPRRVSKLSREILVASTGRPSRERERNIYAMLGAGDYVVMCAAFMAGMEGTFKVEITTNSKRLKFRKLWPPAQPSELEKVFDDGKKVGHIANLGLEGLETIGAGIGDKLNEKADRVVKKVGAFEV